MCILLKLTDHAFMETKRIITKNINVLNTCNVKNEKLNICHKNTWQILKRFYIKDILSKYLTISINKT